MKNCIRLLLHIRFLKFPDYLGGGGNSKGHLLKLLDPKTNDERFCGLKHLLFTVGYFIIYN